MQPKFVEVDRVWLRYGHDNGTLALRSTTLAVERGEFVAVVGPSGCGKSTLMKVVTGLWPPTAGTVKVEGKAVTAPLSLVGMAFQNPTLLPWRTTLANVMLPLEIVRAAQLAVAPQQSRLRGQGARAASPGRARGLRGQLSLAAVRRHAATNLALPGAHPRALAADARRAVRRARHVHARGAVARRCRTCGWRGDRPSSWSRTICARPPSSPIAYW